MTLIAAWVRRAQELEELVVASDSRLTWDQCPKLFPLSRGDGILAFAGDTSYAYPVVLQLLRSIDEFHGTADRSIQLGELRGHLERLITSLLRDVRDTPSNKIDAGFELLLAGYSVELGKWQIWTSRFDQKNTKFSFQNPSKRTVGAVFVGDVAARAHTALGSRLRAGGKGSANIHLDWEPLDVLRDLIRGGKERSIGGPIQMAKVYRHLAVMPYSVLHGGKLALMGRVLMPYEQSTRLVFDPQSHETLKTWDYLRTPKVKERKTNRGGSSINHVVGQT